ncbi:hypothetical protein IGI37_001337 [Enterococcus sp. AZ194]|uniref:Cof-type HAD-IIB family hydrolase n=1 Tax=Enterococcus sp. AZ194 TaxID=2774629 RepID=UPI003F294439
MAIIAIDLDGTLLNEKHEISAVNKQAIQQASKKHVIVIATGRSVYSATAYLRMLDVEGYAVALNGSIIVTHQKEVLYAKSLVFEKALEMAEIGREFGANLSICCSDNVYQVRLSPDKMAQVQELQPGQTPFIEMAYEEAVQLMRSQPILKVGVMHKDLEILVRMKKKMSEAGLQVVFSDTHYIELMAEGVNKGTGIRFLAEKLQVPEENSVIAFGDQENDLELFKVATISVAMSNAKDSVKEKADWVADNREASGVGYTLLRYLKEVENKR